MSKYNSINAYYEQLSEDGKAIYKEIKKLIIQANPTVREILFVSQPYYYLPEHESIKPHHRPSIMLAYFKDHVNIFASGIKPYKNELDIYKITDKDTLQIYYDQPLLEQVLINIFKISLE